MAIDRSLLSWIDQRDGSNRECRAARTCWEIFSTIFQNTVNDSQSPDECDLFRRDFLGDISNASESGCGVLYPCTVKEVIQDRKLDCNFSYLLLLFSTELPFLIIRYESWFSMELHISEYAWNQKPEIQMYMSVLVSWARSSRLKSLEA